MQRRTPDYYPEFHCIGSACSDNCCIGWEIDIDPKTDAEYRRAPGAFGKRLRSNISREGTPHFRLLGERCPFLNEENLCDIIRTLGEAHLCEICDQHPRFSEWFIGVQETGVGLCCEAAAQLILSRRQPVTLIETEQPDAEPDSPPDTEQQAWEAQLFAARETLLALLQNRRFSVPQRVELALRFGEALQECLATQPQGLPALLAEYKTPAPAALSPTDAAARLAGYRRLLTLYESLEPMDTQWPRQLAALKARLPQLLAAPAPAGDPIAEEQFLVNFVFRYFMKAAFDGDALAKLHLAVASWLIFRLMTWAHCAALGEPKLDDLVSMAKAYSKEIEYAEENLERLAEASRESALFAPETLCALL